MKTVAFFNSQGGIGKTTLVYHLAWMLAERGERVLAVDLDPQANLTSMFLPEDALEELWPHGEHPETIFGALRPIIRGLGDVKTPHIAVIDEPPSQSLKPANDPYCLAMLKHYRSLMPMAMESRKPVFALKPADGAIGAHGEAVRNAYGDFLELARRIADHCGAVIS